MKLLLPLPISKGNVQNFCYYTWIGKNSTIFLNYQFVISLTYWSRKKGFAYIILQQPITIDPVDQTLFFKRLQQKSFLVVALLESIKKSLHQAQALTELYELHQQQCYQSIAYTRKLALKPHLEWLGNLLNKKLPYRQ